MIQPLNILIRSCNCVTVLFCLKYGMQPFVRARRIPMRVEIIFVLSQKNFEISGRFAKISDSRRNLSWVHLNCENNNIMVKAVERVIKESSKFITAKINIFPLDEEINSFLQKL